MAPLAQAKVANCDPKLGLNFNQMDARNRATMYNNLHKDKVGDPVRNEGLTWYLDCELCGGGDLTKPSNSSSSGLTRPSGSSNSNASGGSGLTQPSGSNASGGGGLTQPSGNSVSGSRARVGLTATSKAAPTTPTAKAAPKPTTPTAKAAPPTAKAAPKPTPTAKAPAPPPTPTTAQEPPTPPAKAGVAAKKVWRLRSVEPPTPPTEALLTDRLANMDEAINRSILQHPAVAPKGPDFLETDSEPEGLV